MTTLPLDQQALESPAASWGMALEDRLYGWRDALLANASFQRWAARFPLTRPIARRRSRVLFDLLAGFVYSQVLRACVELDLFSYLSNGPMTVEELVKRTSMPRASLDRLIGAAIALQLLSGRSGGRIGLGTIGAPLARNEALTALVEHHALLYDDLRDPLLLLHRTAALGRDTSLSRYYPYSAGTTDAPAPRVDDAHAESYSRLMSATAAPLVAEVLDAYSFGQHRRMLDIGGGEGRFARAVATRWTHLDVSVFDLPAVVERASAATERAGMGKRVHAVGGDFHNDALPGGMDVITLVRVVLDHGDAAVVALLRRAHAALEPGGHLLIVEPMSGVRGAQAVGDAYFAMYLFAMGSGRARTKDELAALCRQAGFAHTRQLRTNYPVSTGILVATR